MYIPQYLNGVTYHFTSVKPQSYDGLAFIGTRVDENGKIRSQVVLVPSEDIRSEAESENGQPVGQTKELEAANHLVQLLAY